MMVFWDGSQAQAEQLAADKDVSFPLLTDAGGEVFGRWDPNFVTPSTTLLQRGAIVTHVDTTWYNDLVEELVYGEPQ